MSFLLLQETKDMRALHMRLPQDISNLTKERSFCSLWICLAMTQCFVCGQVLWLMSFSIPSLRPKESKSIASMSTVQVLPSLWQSNPHHMLHCVRIHSY